ncbi:hypothetical protein FOPG_19867 [Fusarium oxysporum f. sp. conglutinans race 2 54008]|uniref:Uncharacterized protein n=1 Tax=Fusarium oxysporum f. sp. conglutinans race 2 54008 TaxID=1089457 RepID=X0GJR6_FUSOX|nr:hypothetical protein FOPG_19867 [Fusarium oxysporum f. sp. conglutinans race 2 54008]
MGRRAVSESLSCFQLCQKGRGDSYGREGSRAFFRKVEGGNTNLWPFARHERVEVVWLWNSQSRANQEAAQKALEMGGRREVVMAIHIGSGWGVFLFGLSQGL